MEEKTQLLVCLGAAVAANCIPCFDYYYQKAQACGLAPEDIQAAVECAYKIKDRKRRGRVRRYHRIECALGMTKMQ